MLSDSVDSVLPTTLGMVRKSEHYAMAVEYITQQMPPELTKAASKAVAGVSMLRPCSRAVALVLSTKRSKVSQAGAGGYFLVTDDVVDFLEEGSDGSQKIQSHLVLHSGQYHRLQAGSTEGSQEPSCVDQFDRCDRCRHRQC